MISLLSMVASLALVLALLGVSLRMLRRYTATVAGSGRVPLQVLQRVGLGPRQGIALVRIGERVLAVSLGEGGVRPLLELEDEELDALALPAPAAAPALKGDFGAALRAAVRTRCAPRPWRRCWRGREASRPPPRTRRRPRRGRWCAPRRCAPCRPA